MLYFIINARNKYARAFSSHTSIIDNDFGVPLINNQLEDENREVVYKRTC